MVLRFREVAESGANNQLGYSAAIYDISYILRVCFELWIYQVAGLGANSQLGHSAKCSAGGAANCLHSYKHTIQTFCSLEKKSTSQLQLVAYKHSREKMCKKWKVLHRYKLTLPSILLRKNVEIKRTLLPAFTATWILLLCTGVHSLWTMISSIVSRAESTVLKKCPGPTVYSWPLQMAITAR